VPLLLKCTPLLSTAVRQNAAHPTEETPSPVCGERVARKGRVRGTVGCLTGRARQLRQSETLAEDLAWNLLRDRKAFGLKFRRQQPLGGYIVDFYCHELRLIIELEGEVHSQPSKMKRDARRKASLELLGCNVLCVPNGLVLQDPEGFLTKIGQYIPSPGLRPPSPHKRERELLHILPKFELR